MPTNTIIKISMELQVVGDHNGINRDGVLSLYMDFKRAAIVNTMTVESTQVVSTAPRVDNAVRELNEKKKIMQGIFPKCFFRKSDGNSHYRGNIPVITVEMFSDKKCKWDHKIMDFSIENAVVMIEPNYLFNGEKITNNSYKPYEKREFNLADPDAIEQIKEFVAKGK